jgi:hypothetical protein
MRASSGAHVLLRFICPAPRGIGERLGSAGYDISTSGRAHTLVFRSLKPPTDGKEHTVLFVGADEDRGSFTDFPNARPAPFIIGAATLILLFIGIHDAWDTVTYHVYEPLEALPCREVQS